jgi:plastocyanin
LRTPSAGGAHSGECADPALPLQLDDAAGLDHEAGLKRSGHGSDTWIWFGPAVDSSLLETDLAANAGRNVVAMWHKPRYGSGATNLVDVQPFYDVLYQYGADIVLDGHDHIYDRLTPIDASGTPDATFGIRQFTVGTGGFVHHNFGTIKPISQVRNNDTFGVLKLVLRETEYEWTFLPVAGKTFTDGGTGLTHGAPNQDPTFDQDIPDQSDAEGDEITLDAGATDPDGDPLTYAATGLPTGLSIDASTGLIMGTIANTAAAGSPYPTSITVRDGTAVDDTDTFTWTVTDSGGGNLAPTAFDLSFVVPKDGSRSITLSAEDPEGAPLTYAIVTAPSHGTLTGTGSARTYTPVPSYEGKDQFTYKVNDGSSDSNVATVSIVVSTTSTVNVVNSGFKPKTLRILLGGTVRWTFTGSPSTCSATDSSGLALFDSAPRLRGRRSASRSSLPDPIPTCAPGSQG